MKELAKVECEDRIKIVEDKEIGPLEILSSTVDTEPAENDILRVDEKRVAMKL